MSELLAEREQRVTPLELFFDLVFVFAFTQVTTVLSDDPTWTGLGHGLLILGALWWPWASYAWLTNSVDPDETLVWASILVASAAMFVAALAVPEAFGAHGVAFGVFSGCTSRTSSNGTALRARWFAGHGARGPMTKRRKEPHGCQSW